LPMQVPSVYAHNLKMVLSKSVMRKRSSVQDSRTWVEV